MKKPKVFVIGYPKAGTHLLTRCLSLIPGLAQNKFFYREFKTKFDQDINFTGDTIFPRISTSEVIGVKYIIKFLSNCRAGEFIFGHFAYSDILFQLFCEQDFKPIFIFRYPADIIVSQRHHIVTHPAHMLHELFRNSIPDPEAQARLLIEGTEIIRDGEKIEIYSIRERLLRVLPWLSLKGILYIRFEDLIGEQGLGDSGKQQETITRIGEFLEINLSEEKIIEIVQNTFSRKSSTFRKGKIGSGQEELSQELISLLNNMVADILPKFGYLET